MPIYAQRGHTTEEFGIKHKCIFLENITPVLTDVLAEPRTTCTA
jgi:hypothetical protein